MTISYQICASIECTHSYYADGKLQRVQFQPTAETQQIMNNLDLKVRMVGNLFSIYFSPQKAQTLDLDQLPDLHFFLALQDPFFLNFTDLPLDKVPGAGVYSFANQADSFSLTKEAVVSGADWSTEVQPEGPHTFAMVKFSLSIPTASTPAPTFQLAFAARKTIWRYYIKNSAATPYPDLKVESEEVEGGFSSEGEVEVPGLGQAQLFQSDAAFPIPLAEHSRQNISLKNGSETILAHLPYPPINQIRPVQEQGQVFIYSDMYVYL